MTESNYRDLPPEQGETLQAYCSRLERDGYEEMFIRKGLGWHFDMKIEEFGAFFEDYELARLRHLTLLKQIQPARSSYSMIKKVSKNLGISEERAEYWVQRFAVVGELEYNNAYIAPS